MITKIEILKALRWYADQYENGKSLGRAIDDTSTVMKAAADLLEYQDQIICHQAKLVEELKKELEYKVPT